MSEHLNIPDDVQKAIEESGEMGAKRLLDEVASVVYGPRQRDYGTAKANHETIAKLWSAVLGIDVTYQQVIQCMVCLKVARLNTTPDHRDSWIDIAGYAAVWDKAQRGE